MSEQDFKRQLWCNVLTAGITGMANGQRIGANDCVYVADEMLKRYCDRFELGVDQAALLEAMAADKARVDAEIEKLRAEQTEAALKQYREQGPWAAGVKLVHRRNDAELEVISDEHGHEVFVRAGRTKLRYPRADLMLAVPEESDKADVARAPIGLVQ
jgi:hypothetical protein